MELPVGVLLEHGHDLGVPDLREGVGSGPPGALLLVLGGQVARLPGAPRSDADARCRSSGFLRFSFHSLLPVQLDLLVGDHAAPPWRRCHTTERVRPDWLVVVVADAVVVVVSEPAKVVVVAGKSN